MVAGDVVAGKVVAGDVVTGEVVVVAPAGAVVDATVSVVVDPESRLGRRNHTSATVTTTIASEERTATTTSRRFARGPPSLLARAARVRAHRFSTLPMTIDAS